METEYCPQCVEELIKDKKKLGGLSAWLICPKCGLRKRKDSGNYLSQQLTNFEKRIERINLNENQYNKD